MLRKVIFLALFTIPKLISGQSPEWDMFVFVEEIIKKGENLIPNYSFENYSICPIYSTLQPKSYFVDDWTMPTIGTPDYFNSCSNQAGVPANWAGYMHAKSGKGYVGMISGLYFKHEYNYDVREYIQTELKAKLDSEKAYLIKFSVALAQNSKYALDGFGLYLSADITDILDYITPLNFIPEIENEPGKVINTQKGWADIYGIYRARGDEKFAIIGNFIKDIDLIWEYNRGRSDMDYAYYYVDDIYVIPVKLGEPVSFIGNPYLNYLMNNEPISFPAVLFETASTHINDTFLFKLDYLIPFLKMDKASTIIISGHTDNVGSDLYNQKLSKNRANTIYSYLVKQKISSERINVESYGKNKPVANNSTNQGKALNRRVEIMIMNNE